MLEQELVEQLGMFGIQCSQEQASCLLKHLSLVIEKNKVVNLTRILNEEEAVTLHIVDSLLPLACERVSLGEESQYVDLGTGAGFPGIPLVVMTGAQGLLIDSVGKKVAAVAEFAQELRLSSVRTAHTRVEDLPKQELGNKDYVFARAVAQANVLVEYAAPLLKKGGVLVLEKARPEDSEIVAAEKAAKICGMNYVSRETFELPFGRGHREILIYEKVANPSIKLPRKAGAAKHAPLGE